nr:TetR/AcrR family transcriptional regulator [Hyphomonas sp. Mor2]
MANPAPKRKRLAPEERKEQILDVAAAMIRENGVSAVNMDRLGREAGISKPLVYVYFPNRIELLKSLLLREVQRFHRESGILASTAGPLEELVRASSRKMLEYVQEFGIVIQQLMLEPEVADVLEELDTKFQEQYKSYLAKRVRDEYGVDSEVAAAVVEVGLGLSDAAGAYLEQSDGDLDFIEDILTAMVMGSLERATARARSGKIRTPSRTKSAAE